MKRGKTLVGVGMAVAAVVVLAAAVVMFKGLSQAATTRGERDTAREKLAKYYRNKPFPNAENVALEKANLETVKTWYERLLADLQSSNIPTNETSPIAFNSRREAMTTELVAQAPAGEGGDRVVSADFGFGFNRYKLGDLAKPSDVPRLIRQLRMTELLVREMYAAGVLRITTATREEFETAVGETPAEDTGSSGRRKRGGDRNAAAAPEASSADGRVEGPVPMDRQRFSFELVANEASLTELLNRIARMDMFAVVTRVELSKNGPDYVLAPSSEAAAEPVGNQPVVANPLPPSRTARLVSGRNREATLKVTLDVEVYSFEGGV